MTDPRMREVFRHLRAVIDLLEDIHSEVAAVPPAARPEPPADNRTKPTLVDVKEAARLLGIGRTRVYQLIGSGRLEAVKLGKSRRVVYASLERLGMARRNG